MPQQYNVVFDLGGVLLHWSPVEILQKCFPDEAKRTLVRREVFQHPDWLEMDRGTLLEHEAIPRFQQRTGCSHEELTMLMKATNDHLDVIPDTREILKELAEHQVPLYCLSNMPATKWDSLRARHAFFELFDGIVISGQIKLVKPDRAIFDHLAQQFGIDPKESIFIDDHLPNIESAANLGFKTHHFKDPAGCRRALRTQFGFERALRA
jgi:HAD superfamily hydrolase (TIGR01509 family)